MIQMVAIVAIYCLTLMYIPQTRISNQELNAYIKSITQFYAGYQINIQTILFIHCFIYPFLGACIRKCVSLP